MVGNHKPQMFGNSRLDLLNSRVAKFDHFPALLANHVVVLFVSIRLLKLRDVFAKLVFADQVARDEQVDGVVQGGAAYPVLLVLHLQVQRLYIEVSIVGINLVQDRKAFGSFPVAVFAQVILKNVLNSVFNFRVRHVREFQRTKLQQIWLSIGALSPSFGSDSADSNHPVYLFEFLHQIGQVVHIVHINHYCSFKDAVIGVEADGTHVDVVLA